VEVVFDLGKRFLRRLDLRSRRTLFRRLTLAIYNLLTQSMRNEESTLFWHGGYCGQTGSTSLRASGSCVRYVLRKEFHVFVYICMYVCTWPRGKWQILRIFSARGWGDGGINIRCQSFTSLHYLGGYFSGSSTGVRERSGHRVSLTNHLEVVIWILEATVMY
jgi:hypothetical protein